MSYFLSPQRTVALACAGAALSFNMGTARAAEGEDAIVTDRPDVVESSEVVGFGRIQLETGTQWERRRDAVSHERTTTTPTLLRIGVSESVELRFETEGRVIVHGSDPGSGAHATLAGYADLAVGMKWHVANGQGARPSLAVIADAELPSGSRALRGHGIRPALRVSAEWELGNGWEAGVMPGVGLDREDGQARHGYGVFAAVLGKELTPRARVFVEVAAPQIARARHGGTQALANAGMTWLVNRDCQLDVSVGRGLNRRSPDLGIGFGVSFRR